nr:reverse transcriptase domain-containing protein [Tanacetum cinerariifolium]
MPRNVNIYNGSDNPDDHLKIFQAAVKVERWAMSTWCHMFNFTLTRSGRVWFDDLPLESIDSYDDLKKAFLANYLQQKKRIKDPEEIHHIKQREGESTEDFVQRFKNKSRHIKEDLECMRIFGFMRGITNPKLIKPRKLSHVIKKLKQWSGKDQPKAEKKGEISEKDKAMAILMVQPWQKVARQRITQSFSLDLEISFPPRGDKDETKGHMIIEAEIRGHFIHLMSPSPYYEIIGRPRIKKIQAIPSTAYKKKSMWRFIRNIQKTITIDSTLTKEGRKALCELLRCNLDIFSWKPEDMMRVPRHLAERRLNVREGSLPVRQKKRSQAPERNKAIQEEVEKLVDTGIMKKVHYRRWLSKPVMVKKHDDTWKMCVDFKYLNKACLKGGYLLPEIKIDWKVESLCGYHFTCLLDAYKV